MSSPTSGGGWQDRRGLFQPGREVHEPAPPRRPSNPKAASPPASPSASTTAASTAASTAMPTAAERRRSSASGAAGMFANLHSHKRGSQDYDTRRQNWAEMNEPKGAIAKAFENMIKK